MSKHAKRLLWVVLTFAVIGLVPTRAYVAPKGGSPAPWALLRWDDAVGRVLGQEADSEGPKSFAVTPEGGILLLDQVNRRVLDLDAAGTVVGTLALPSAAFDDIEQFEGRAVVVLDRLVGKTLLVMDRKGTRLAAVAVEGRGIEQSGLITAMLSRPDGIWLEVEHRHSVKVLDRNLRPCERQVVLGRPIANARSLRGALDGAGGIRISTGRRNDRVVEHTATLTDDAPIRRIVWLDADAKGQVHAVLHEIDREPTAPFRVKSERYRLVVLDEQLQELGRTVSPWVLTEYNQRVEFRLGPDGRLWQMAFTPEGVALVDWGRRTP